MAHRATPCLRSTVLALCLLAALSCVPDSDGDGVPDADDFQPSDAACWRELDGDGSACHVTTLPTRTVDQLEIDASGVLHVLLSAEAQVLRWDTRLGRFIEPLALRPGVEVRRIAVSDAHGRVYVAYADGAITYFSAPTGLLEKAFRSIDDLETIAAPGDWLVTVEWSPSGRFVMRNHDVRGTEKGARNLYSLAPTFFAWNPVTSRLYYGSALSNTTWTMIDPATGAFTYSRTDYAPVAEHAPPITVSPDGQTLLASTGTLRDAELMLEFDSLAFDEALLAWPSGSGPITLVPENGNAVFERRDPALRIVESRTLPGDPVGLFDATSVFPSGPEAPGRLLAVTATPDRWHLDVVVTTDDSDGDGVTNTADAFPHDPAASVDRDVDGHPDLWNEGLGEADSTAGLSLDAQPERSSCHRPTTDPDAGCDLDPDTLAYTPDTIELGVDGTILLFSRDLGRVFRWSTSQLRSLDPLVVGSNPLLRARQPETMGYAPAEDRLYLGYASRTITKIESGDVRREVEAAAARYPVVDIFAGAPLMVAGTLVPPSDYEPSAPYVRHYSYDRDGRRVRYSDFSPDTSDQSYDSVFDRHFHFDSGERIALLPYIRWYRKDPITGETLEESGRSLPLDKLVGPIRPSRDGEWVLTGAGEIRGAETLGIDHVLPNPIHDATWIHQGQFVTIRPDGSGATRVEQWGPDYALQFSQTIDGTPLRILSKGDRIIVVSLVAGVPTFTQYFFQRDGDGDGVANLDDAFPLDPAASIDRDGDGYPDAWNPGYDDQDSTTGLTLDAFPEIFACHDASQASASDPDVCDIGAALPPYVPTSVDVDAEGTIFLVGPAAARVFRWSAAAESHADSIPIRGAPASIDVFEPEGRLYVGDDSDWITTLDLGVRFPREEVFAVVPRSDRVSYLERDGSTFFVMKDTRNTRYFYLFDEAGNQLAYRFSLKADSQAHWDRQTDRVFLSNPYGAQWLALDRVAQTISAPQSITAPSGVSLGGAVVGSPDGARLLFGTGALFDATTLTYESSLPEPITEGLWLANGDLITVRPTGNGRTLLEHRLPDLTVTNATSLPGDPLFVVEAAGKIVAITEVAGRPAFHVYVPSDDGDGDGVPNDVDAFPVDPAASVDDDEDGYPDAWNPGKGPGDSYEDLTLDAYPGAFACQLPEHGFGGVCDFDPILPANSDPDFCDADPSIVPGSSGALELGPISELVALCDGWVLVSEIDPPAVRLLDVVSARTAGYYRLPAEPRQVRMDAASKALWVTFFDVPAIARVDLVGQAVEIFDVPEPAEWIALDGNDGAFVLGHLAVGLPSQPQWSLYWVPSGGSPVTGPSLIPGYEFLYNVQRAELLVWNGAYGFWRGTYDPVIGFTELQLSGPRGPAGAVLSPDGTSLVASYSYTSPFNLPTVALDPADLNDLQGFFINGGTPTERIAFDRTGDRVVAWPFDSIQIFDTQTYQRLLWQSWTICHPVTRETLAFSRGGRMLISSGRCLYVNGVYEPYGRIVWDTP